MPKQFASGTKPRPSGVAQTFAHGRNLGTSKASRFVLIVSMLVMFHSITIFGHNPSYQCLKASIRNRCKIIPISGQLLVISHSLKTSASVWWPVPPPLKPEEDEFEEWTMKPMGRRSDPASVRNEPLPPKNIHSPCSDLYWPMPKWGYIAHRAHARLHWQGLRISNPCICGIFRRNTGLTGFSASLCENGKV